jgi:peroxiredoxin
MREEIEAKGTRLAFVHLSSEEKAQKFSAPYGLADLPRFADPEGRLYQAFGLVRAHWHQYLNYKSILRMLNVA